MRRRSAGGAIFFAVLAPAGAGAASFGTASNIYTPSNPARLAVAGIDHDGDQDVVYCQQTSNPSTVGYVANGDGTTYGTGTSWTAFSITTLSGDCQGVAVADVDDNGWPDVIAARTVEIKVCLNSTSKTRADSAASPSWTCTSYTSVSGKGVGGVAAGDMDHDGDLDVVFSGDTTGWLAGDGAGGFTDSINQITALMSSPRRVFVVDIDNDGDNDVLVGESGGGTNIWLFCSNGASSPTWTAVAFNSGGGSGDWMDGIGVADMDKDGRLDIVFTDMDGTHTDRLLAWQALSGSNCAGLGAQTTILSDVDGPDPVVVEDLDDDGDADVATLVHSGTAATLDNTLQFFANDGTGATFTRTQVDTYTNGVVSNDSDLVVGDFNGDGKKDMVGSSVSGDSIDWWAGTSTSGYPVPVLVAGPDHQNWMEACVRTWTVTSGNSGSYTQVRPHIAVSCGSSVSSIAAWDGFWVLNNNAALNVLLRPRPSSFTGSTSSQTLSKTSLTANNYYLLGTPLDPDSTTSGSGKPNDVLGDDLGGSTAYETKWRSSHLINYSTGTRYYRWQGGSGTDSSYYWLPGRGFWLIHDGSVTTTIDVTGTEMKQLVGTAPYDGARIVRLAAPNTTKNYQQLANPFNYAFYWADAAIRKPQYTGEGIKAVVNEAPPPKQLKRPKRNLPNWRLQLGVAETTSGGVLRDTDDCFLGMWGSAVDGSDGNDLAKLAPPTSSFVRLFFPHDDPDDPVTYWAEDPKLAANDFRELRRTRQSWTLVVQTTADTGTYRLTWQHDQPLPRRMPLVLTDVTEGTTVDMRAGHEYVFAAGPGRRQFRIDVDTRHARRPCPRNPRRRHGCRG